MSSRLFLLSASSIFLPCPLPLFSPAWRSKPALWGSLVSRSLCLDSARTWLRVCARVWVVCLCVCEACIEYYGVTSRDVKSLLPHPTHTVPTNKNIKANRGKSLRAASCRRTGWSPFRGFLFARAWQCPELFKKYTSSVILLSRDAFVSSAIVVGIIVKRMIYSL